MKQFITLVLAAALMLFACAENNNNIMANSSADAQSKSDADSESDSTSATDTIQQIPYTGDASCDTCNALSDEMWMYFISTVDADTVGQPVESQDITINLTYTAYQESMQDLNDGDDPEEVRVEFYEAMDEAINGADA